jgi:RNA polymerase sigma factor (sigma-70 family)
VTSGARVFLVDDDASVRRALTRLLVSAGYRVESFASAEAFLEKRIENEDACLVLDVRMPGLDGMQLQNQLTERNSLLPVIFITGHGDIPMSVRAMKAGAVDFLAKPFESEALLGAIENAVSRGREANQLQREREEIRELVASLTAREREVMLYVVTGMLNKQIAYQLGISEKTIKVHRARVMEKMRAGSVAELVRITEKAGLTAPVRKTD